MEISQIKTTAQVHEPPPTLPSSHGIVNNMACQIEAESISPTISKLEAALAYAAKGWPVFSLTSGTKIPMKDSNDFKDATTDPEVIKNWWEVNPDCNIGIRTGKEANLIVLDFDVKNGAKGRDAYALLKKDHDLNTLMSRTPPRGIHLLFEYNGNDTRNNASTLLEGMDTRAEGGYIVAPGSTTSEGRYEWDDESKELATLPNSLRHFMRTKKISADAKSEPFDSEAALQGFQQGNRDDGRNRFANSLAGKGVPEHYARRIITVAAKQCTPPFDVDTALEKVDRAYARHSQYADENKWENPVPLEEYQLPDWPEGVFPEPLNNFVVSVTRSVEVPIEVAFMDTLAVCATAVQGKYELQIKDDYREPLKYLPWRYSHLPPARPA